MREKMVRDDLYTTVPSFFRCPISLDVMKSPVSLCTGVTYDRDSIQRWLDSGSNTCPATMQVLQSKEFVPNRTLQRLIHVWSDSVQQHRVRSTELENLVICQDQVKDIVNVTDIKNEDFAENFSKIISFAGESDENKKFLAEMDGFVVLLVEILIIVKDKNILEQVVRVLALILNKIDDQEHLMNLMLKKHQDSLTSLFHALKQEQNVDLKIDSLKILEFIAVDAESKLLIAEREGLLSELKHILTSNGADQPLIGACLSCLVSISVPKRVKSKLITNYKLIPELKKLITDGNVTVSTTEKVLKLIETFCYSKQGRAEICNDSNLMQAIVQKMLKVSSVATEHAVTIVWSVCYLFRDQRAQEAVTAGSGLTKILMVMQSNCSPGVRQMSGDLLKIFRMYYKNPEK
ncbi:U-box domain-containing protein 27-like isoform X2 [Mangifera indica]|uniref:U-box domain-containing protein 27-like isoform X2 n=1 Tax=Mangifera indica TaxID=29780 RepID=UPI001CFA657F|nr:U-box domain-containing protein 27-like isoform X2 [Mangifera indica]